MGVCMSSTARKQSMNHTAKQIVQEESSPSRERKHIVRRKVRIETAETDGSKLQEALDAATRFLEEYKDEKALTAVEIESAMSLYKELQRVLSVGTRTRTSAGTEANFKHVTDFDQKFEDLWNEFEDAEKDVAEMIKAPAAIRPLGVNALQELNNDFFILDNSLRETTVGVARGHTLEEKHKILEAMADTGLEEVILGSFGAKISVDSQIAQQWRVLGKTMDCAWGFSDAYDFEPYDESPLWKSVEEYQQAARSGETPPEFFSPPANPKLKYSKDDYALMNRASKGFTREAMEGKNMKLLMKSSQSPTGRVPLGLLMMVGYGISNAILEVDTSLEKFDYDTFDVVERMRFLIKFCKAHLPRRENVKDGEDDSPRVLVNLRDFANYQNSKGGLKEALRLVDALCRLPENERPFGFMMEEPTGFLWPDEVGRLCRMVRLTMDRAGHPEGRFLVHLHWFFGLAEATQLTALCNGADGVWAAVCKTGAQVGHACFTMTALNLFRAGHKDIAEKYNMKGMCEAARVVTEIATRRPCPAEEEVYGEQAFDIPFIMTSVPSCRYIVTDIMSVLGLEHRNIRLNELSSHESIHNAMVHHFGDPEQTGWEPQYIPKMWDAIVNHLMTGLSRDYNSPLGLGHLYGLVSRKLLPTKMVFIMLQHTEIPDTHPTVLEFIQRWNRLCMKYEGKKLPPHPAARSKSIMMWNTDITMEPRLLNLPFDYFLADVMRQPVMEPIPRIFKLQVIHLVTNDERKIQGRKNPTINFYDSILRLKLFIQEAPSLGVMALVEDFCIRKNHDFFFGEDHLWLREVRGSRPKMLNKMIRKHIDFFPQYYENQGNNAMLRCVRAAAKRIELNEGIRMDVSEALRRGSAFIAVQSINQLDTNTAETSYTAQHAQIFKELVDDEGQDEQQTAEYWSNAQEVLEWDTKLLSEDDDLASAYVCENEATLSILSSSKDPPMKSKRLSMLLAESAQMLLDDEHHTVDFE